MINIQGNFAEDEKFQKNWNYLAFICKVKIATHGVYFGIILWYALLWKKHELFASLIFMAIYVALLVRIAFFFPRSKCWLVTYYVVDILNAIAVVGFLLVSPQIVELAEVEFASQCASKKIYWIANFVLFLIQVITLVFSLVICNKLLCCPGYTAQHYHRLNNPSHHVIGQVSPPGYTEQPQKPTTGYTNYYADSRDDAKLIVDV